MNRLLTVKDVESFAPQAKVYHKKASPLDGFWLRIATTGRKTWLLSYTSMAGQSRTLTLGMYPQLDPVEAQKAAKIALGIVAAGGDPQQAKTAKRHQLKQDQADSFSAVCDLYIEACKKKGQRAWRQKRAALNRHARPMWKDRPIRSIKRKDVQALMDQLDAAHGYDKAVSGKKDPVRVSNVARDIAGKLGGLFRWADRRDLLDEFPTRNLDTHGVPLSRDRVLQDWELALVLEAVGTLAYPVGPFLKLLLLSAQRRCQISRLIRTEVTISQRMFVWPADRMKADKPHSLPIADEAMKVILGLPVHGEFLFSYDGGKTPLCSFGRVKDQLTAAVAAIAKERGIEPVRPFVFHDFRRTARSQMGELGVLRDHAELILAHRLGDSTAQTYDQAKYRDQKLGALTAWEQYLMQIVEKFQQAA